MTPLNRRAVLTGLALAATPLGLKAEDQATTVWWGDLAPKDENEGELMETLKLLGLLKQGEMLPWIQQTPARMVTKYNEQLVRIPGYVVPVALDGEGVTEGLLVPYVGACIHVPPPPVNQIVFLKFEKPIPQDGLWDPIWATGMFTAAAVETDLAEAGYMMTGTVTEPYTG